MNKVSGFRFGFLTLTEDGGRMRLNRIAFFATLLSILFLGASFKAWADDDDIETYGQPESHDFINHRTYVGFSGTSVDIDNNNDFNGYEGFITAPVSLTGGGFTNEELDYVPAINRNFGFAGMVGHREGPWAIELSYWYSNHSASIYSSANPGVPVTVSTAVFTTLNVDLKRYFFTNLPIQPFIDVGVNFASLTSQNTSELFSYDAATKLFDQYAWSGTQTDTGYGLNLGIGGELYLGDGFSLVGGAIQRFTTFQQINGVTKANLTPDPGDLPEPVSGTTVSAGTNQGSLGGNGLNFYLGMTVGFDQ
jgi:hypothetical protein